jgi:cell division septation protein DedD
MVQQHIYQLLLDNDCVVVPGLGGFICQYHSASIDLKRGVMSPPGRSIAFNKALQQNDGLLIQHISVAEILTFKDAEEKVRAFVTQCNQRLHQHGSVLMPNIGRLYMDELKHIQFAPSAEMLPLEEAFGLASVSIQPVTRLKDAVAAGQKEEVKVVALPSSSEKSTQKSWPYWVAASVAAVFLSATLWINGTQPGISEYVMAGFSPVPAVEQVKSSAVEEVQTPVQNEANQSDEMPLAEVVTTDVPQSPPSTIVETSNNVGEMHSFSIVVGAYKGPLTANRYADELKNKGYNAEVIDPGNNLWLKVVIHVQAADEISALRSIRSEVEPQAWLYQ